MKPSEKQTLPTNFVSESIVLQDHGNSVVTLTLNRPKQYNALSEVMLDKLQEHLDAIAENDAYRIVILRVQERFFVQDMI